MQTESKRLRLQSDCRSLSRDKCIPWLSEFCIAQMHVLEAKLESTIGYLSGLERSSSSLQQALENSGDPGFATAEQQAERQESSKDASTSEVGLSGLMTDFNEQEMKLVYRIRSPPASLCQGQDSESLDLAGIHEEVRQQTISREWQSCIIDTSTIRTKFALNQNQISPLWQAQSRRKGALHSGLDIPDTLREFWYPVEFSSKWFLCVPVRSTLHRTLPDLMSDSCYDCI